MRVGCHVRERPEDAGCRAAGNGHGNRDALAAHIALGTALPAAILTSQGLADHESILARGSAWSSIPRGSAIAPAPRAAARRESADDSRATRHHDHCC